MDNKCSENLEKYVELILLEKKIRNIIGASNAKEIFNKHISSSLNLLEIVRGRKGIDIGSGNGLPGVVVAIGHRSKNITLLDSSASKINFLNMVKRRCGLDNVNVLRGRAEKLARRQQYREKFDFVLSRALAPLKIGVELCLPFVKKGGHYYVMSGSGSRDESKAAQEIIKSTGGVIDKITPSGIIIIKKLSPTPEKFPRRWKKMK